MGCVKYLPTSLWLINNKAFLRSPISSHWLFMRLWYFLCRCFNHRQGRNVLMTYSEPLITGVLTVFLAKKVIYDSPHFHSPKLKQLLCKFFSFLTICIVIVSFVHVRFPLLFGCCVQCPYQTTTTLFCHRFQDSVPLSFPDSVSLPHFLRWP